jgi:hypothetical protein
VIVTDGLPAGAEDGLTDVIAGPATGGGLMVNVTAFEVVPPEFTVTLALPAIAIRLADTEAVNRVALTKVVVSADPFQYTVAPDKKPVPFTVSVKAVPVAVAEAGLRVVMALGEVVAAP